jgi:beta-galactosidase
MNLILDLSFLIGGIRESVDDCITAACPTPLPAPVPNRLVMNTPPLLLAENASLPAEFAAPRERLNFDFDWRFHRGFIDEFFKAVVDDADWRVVHLPHDWSIENLPGGTSPHDPLAEGGLSHGYHVGGIGLYRKRFHVSAGLRGKRFRLCVDGAYMNTDVWLNGERLGNHPNGYTPFAFDLTEKIRFEGENLLALEVKNVGPNSRWYSGSGLYRHVWLEVTGPTHVDGDSLFITTPDITEDQATAVITGEVRHSLAETAEFHVQVKIRDAEGAVVTTETVPLALGGGTAPSFRLAAEIRPPRLWTLEAPHLYTATVELLAPGSGELVDRFASSFGIRSISFDPKSGFRLNGQPTLLRGACVHHDHGPLGAAAFDRAEERRVELLKASGFNAIRTAHNPPSPGLLDACDRLGMLVIDEIFDMWNVGKKPYDYSLYFAGNWRADLRRFILRDRNRPSVILWSTGNEIPNKGTPEGIRISADLSELVRTLDPTRPTTNAVNELGPERDAFFATFEIAGYNYAGDDVRRSADLYAKDHARVPDRVIYGSESYPLNACESWMSVVDLPYVVGDFVWTGVDYLGEASIGWRGYPQEGSFYPWTHAFCGDLDICGFKRPQSYYRDVLWKHGQLLSIFVEPPEPSFPENPRRAAWSRWHWHDHVANWNWENHVGEVLPVHVFCAYEEVELFLNGASLGCRPCNRETEWRAVFEVPYAPGVLLAVAREGGREVARETLSTAGEVERLRLAADHMTLAADGQDLSFVTIELLDAEGHRHPTAGPELEIEVVGAGTLAGVGTSDPTCTEGYQGPRRHAYQGRALAIVRSTRKAGPVELFVRTPDLPTAKLVLESH